MSWDIFVQDLPVGIASVAHIPNGFRPRPLGSRDHIINTIRRVAPMADFSDPTWGRIDGPGFSIEVSIGQDDPVTSFAFHVRGGNEAAGVIADILGALDLRAIDPQSETGLFDRSSAEASLERWRSYRDQVTDRP